MTLINQLANYIFPIQLFWTCDTYDLLLPGNESVSEAWGYCFLPWSY